MGATKKKILKSLKRSEMRRSMGLWQDGKVAARSGEILIHNPHGYVAHNIHTGNIASGKGDIVVSKDDITYLGSSSGSLGVTGVVITGAAKGFGRIEINAPAKNSSFSKKKTTQATDGYVDPILYELGIFANKQDYDATTDGFVERIKRGEIQLRQAEEDSEGETSEETI